MSGHKKRCEHANSVDEICGHIGSKQEADMRKYANLRTQFTDISLKKCGHFHQNQGSLKIGSNNLKYSESVKNGQKFCTAEAKFGLVELGQDYIEPLL